MEASLQTQLTIRSRLLCTHMRKRPLPHNAQNNRRIYIITSHRALTCSCSLQVLVLTASAIIYWCHDCRNTTKLLQLPNALKLERCCQVGSGRGEPKPFDVCKVAGRPLTRIEECANVRGVVCGNEIWPGTARRGCPV